MTKNSNPFITLVEAQARLATLGADPTSRNPYANVGADAAANSVDWREHVRAIYVEKIYTPEKYFKIGVHLDLPGFNSFAALVQQHKGVRRAAFGYGYDRLSITIDDLLEVYTLEQKKG